MTIPPEPAPEPAIERTALGSRLALWLAFGALGSLLAPAPLTSLALITYNTGVVALFFWDRARLRRAQIALTRSVPQRLRAHVPAAYALCAELKAGPALRLVLEESTPPDFVIAPTLQRFSLRAAEPAQRVGQITAQRHGRAALETIAVRRESRLGLCAIVAQQRCPSQLSAYPKLGRVPSRGAALEPRQQGGAPHPVRSADQGSEIEALREYTATDPMRSIDWKATAKRQRPITRAFQPERNQTVWIVLDASRVMSLPSSEHSEPAQTRFEAVLEAALSLSQTALGQGDRVGLLVFAREARLCVPARRGRAHFRELVERILSVHAEASELNAGALVAALARAAPKRCLLVFFTDLDNDADLRELARSLPLLTRRHLAFCVSLEAAALKQRLSKPVESDRDVYRKLAAIHLAEERAQLAKLLGQGGLTVVESSAQSLPEAILRRYREAKLGGRI